MTEICRNDSPLVTASKELEVSGTSYEFLNFFGASNPLKFLNLSLSSSLRSTNRSSSSLNPPSPSLFQQNLDVLPITSNIGTQIDIFFGGLLISSVFQDDDHIGAPSSSNSTTFPMAKRSANPQIISADFRESRHR